MLGPDARASFCQDATWICDDFDDAAVSWPIPPWGVKGIDPRARVTRTDSGGLSPPSAMEIVLPPTGDITADLAQSYAGPLRGFRCEMKLQLAAVGQVTGDLFRVSVQRQGVDVYGVALGTGQFFDGPDFHPIPPIPIGKWTRIVVEARAGAPVSLTFNGESAISVDGGGQTSNLADGGGSATLFLGLAHSGSDLTNSWRVLYDDVRCDPLN